MAGQKKISDLEQATELNNLDLIPIVQDGENKKLPAGFINEKIENDIDAALVNFPEIEMVDFLPASTPHNVVLSWPTKSYNEYAILSALNISVEPTTKIDAGAILPLKADGTNIPTIVGASPVDASVFFNTVNFINDIIFYNLGSRIVYKILPAYTLHPYITTQPVAHTVTEGDSVSFMVVATSPTAISYQWQRNTGSGFVDISGATSSTYTHTSSFGENGYSYRCVLTNAAGSATSNDVVLTVNSAAPVIYFSLSQDRSKIIAIADKDLNSSPSFVGITVSGGKTITGIVRNSLNTSQYDLTLNSAYAYTDSPTISIPSGLWSSADSFNYLGGTNISVSKFYVRNASILEVTDNVFTSNSGSSFAAFATSKIPLVGDFTFDIDVTGSSGRAGVIGVNTTNANEPYNNYEYYCLIDFTGTDNIVSGKNGSNVDSASFVSATDTKLRLKRVSGVFTVWIYRSGSWTLIYTISGTESGLVYPSFSLFNNNVVCSIVNPLIS